MARRRARRALKPPDRAGLGRPARAGRSDRAGGRTRAGNGRGGRAASSGSWWRRWTLGVLLVSAVIVPLIFDLLDQDTFAQAKLAMLHLFVPLAALGPLAALVTGRIAWRVRPRWPDLAVVAFAGLAVLAWILSVSPEVSLEGERFQWQGLVSLLTYAVAYFVARAVLADASALRKLFGALAFATLIIAIYAILQQLRMDPWWGVLNKGRVFSTLGQANNLAAYFVLVIPCVAVLALTGPRLLRAIAAGTLLPSLAALALTLSRGGYLGLAAGVAAGALAIAPAVAASVRVDRRWLGGGAVAVVAALVLVLAIPPTRDQAVRIAERAASIVNPRDPSARSHFDLWAVGLAITVDHPLVGTGPDTYALVFSRYRDDVLAPDRAERLKRFRPESPHNVYIAYASGLGVPALTVYLALVAMVLARAIRSVRSNSGPIRVFGVALIGAMVGHLVSDAFMTAELTGSWLFWTFLGAAASLPLAVEGTRAEGAAGGAAARGGAAVGGARGGSA